MDDEIKGLDIKGTDKFDEWWEQEHQEEDVDDVESDNYDDEICE